MNEKFCAELSFSLYFTEYSLKQKVIKKGEKNNYYYFVSPAIFTEIKKKLKYDEIKLLIEKGIIIKDDDYIRKKQNDITNTLKKFYKKSNNKGEILPTLENVNPKQTNGLLCWNNDTKKNYKFFYYSIKKSNIIKSGFCKDFEKNLNIKSKMYNVILQYNDHIIFELVSNQIYEVFKINDNLSLTPNYLILMVQVNKDFNNKLLYYKSFDFFMNKENIIMEQKKKGFHLKKDNSLFGFIHLINKDYKFNNYSNNYYRTSSIFY